MSFPQAVASAFRQYVGFHGRARRSEYWWFVLFTFLLSMVAGLLDSLLGVSDEFGNGPVGVLAALATFLPSLAVAVRRLHDTSRSGWWVLISLVPIVGLIVLIVFCVQDSTPGTNEHGPHPKDPAPGLGYGAPQPYGIPQGHGTPSAYGSPTAAQPYGAPSTFGTQQAPDPRFGTPPQG